MQARERLIVSLDVPEVKQAEQLVKRLEDHILFYKIGHQLAFTGGLELARDLIAQGKKVFLDLKLLDIDNTIRHAVENLAKLGISMLTLHAYPAAMRAAVAGARDCDLCLLAVTVLTSMDDADLLEAGYDYGAKALVLKRAQQAAAAGFGGVVASAQEAAQIRSLLGDDMIIVTPGIRPHFSAIGDQKRVLTPAEAITSGASHLVVGRPIIKAQDPLQATVYILQEMEKALSI